MNQWKSALSPPRPRRARWPRRSKGADAFFGLSVKGAVTQEMVAAMAAKPIIFAMANPDPEITPEDVAEVRADAIVATGRSDYPNQINNVLGFPFIFRGALDVQASTINEAMKIAAAKALAELARAEVPDQVAAAFLGRQVTFGPDYIIPAPFDPRLIVNVPPAVAKAAMDTGVARKPIVDMEAYVAQLAGRLDPVAGWLHSRSSARCAHDAQARRLCRRRAAGRSRAPPTLFPQGLRAADPDRPPARRSREQFRAARHRCCGPNDRAASTPASRRIWRSSPSSLRAPAARGYLQRDCQRLVTNDRNVFAALHGGAGPRRRHGLGRHAQLDHGLRGRAPGDGRRARPARDRRVAGAPARPRGAGRRHQRARHADRRAARRHRRGGRGASRAASASSRASRSSPTRPSAIRAASARTSVREAVQILDERRVDFEYDGDMAADVALNRERCGTIRSAA